MPQRSLPTNVGKCSIPSGRHETDFRVDEPVAGTKKMRRCLLEHIWNTILWPVGENAIVPIVLLVPGFLASFLAISSCNFASIQREENQFTSENSEPSAFGFFRYKICPPDNICGCTAYAPYTRFDSIFACAKALAFTATGWGGVMVIASCFLYYLPLPKYILKKFIGVTLLLCAIFQGLAFMVLRSESCKDVTCVLGSGAYSSAVACVIWVVAAFGVFRFSPPETVQNMKFSSDTDILTQSEEARHSNYDKNLMLVHAGDMTHSKGVSIVVAKKGTDKCVHFREDAQGPDNVHLLNSDSPSESSIKHVIPTVAQ